MTTLGKRSNPHIVAPDDWKTNGVEYGAFCKCHKCGLVARSTMTFDYYAPEPGDPLTCETCNRGIPYTPDVAMVQEIAMAD